MKNTKKTAGRYVLQVNAPAAANAEHWNYPPGYFPRKFHYVVEAEEVAKQAIRNGATQARIEGPNGIELTFKPQHQPGEIQCAPLTKLRQGDHVWVAYAYETNRGEIKSSVSERVFERVVHNFMGKGEDRYALVIPGSPFGQNYGTAYPPSKVYRTRDEAVKQQRAAITDKINAWRDVLDRAW